MGKLEAVFCESFSFDLHRCMVEFITNKKGVCEG